MVQKKRCENENDTTNAQSNEIDNFGKQQCALKMGENKNGMAHL